MTKTLQDIDTTDLPTRFMDDRTQGQGSKFLTDKAQFDETFSSSFVH